MYGVRDMSNKLVKRKEPPHEGGIEFFNHIGYIFIFASIASFILLGFVSTLPQNYEKYNIPLCFGIWTIISSVLLIIGVLPLLLGKYCKKYQFWAEKEIISYANKIIKLEEKSLGKEMRKHK